MKEPRQKQAWLAPLGWGIGALAVVVASLLAMRQGSLHAAGRQQGEARAAVALGPER